LGGAGLLAACTGAVMGHDPGPVAVPTPPPYRLRIAIFEARDLDLPFHAGMLIDAPEGRILYDPAGFWHHDACNHTGDVHHPIDDAIAADWLARGARDGIGVRWTLHLFETDVPAATASRARALALTRPDAPSMTCAWSVADLLSRLPGFEGIEPHVVTARLLDALRARPDLRYTRRELA
jgi:hypothetical protein